MAIALLCDPATWPFLQSSVTCHQSAGVALVQFCSSALCTARPQAPWAVQPLGGQRTWLPAPLPPTCHRVFCSCPTSYCLYRHCSYFSFARTSILTFPWLFQAPVFLGFFMSFLASTYGQHTGCTCSGTIPASARGAVLALLLMPLDQRSWCLWIKGPLKILHMEAGCTGWQLIALFTPVLKTHLHPGPIQNTGLPLCV